MTSLQLITGQDVLYRTHKAVVITHESSWSGMTDTLIECPTMPTQGRARYWVASHELAAVEGESELRMFLCLNPHCYFSHPHPTDERDATTLGECPNCGGVITKGARP